jgi:hypothetical protein
MLLCTYYALLTGNAVVIAAAMRLHSKMFRACQLAGILTAAALIMLVVPLANLVFTPNRSPEAGTAIQILARYAAPLLVELLALLTTVRWLLRRTR